MHTNHGRAADSDGVSLPGKPARPDWGDKYQGKATAEARLETDSKSTLTVKPQPQGEAASDAPAT